MNVRARFLPALLLAGLILALGACSRSGTESSKASDLLQGVPADTPYVLLSSDRLPEALVKRQLAAVAASNADNSRSLQAVLEGGDLPSPEWEKAARLALAFNQELAGKLNPEGLAALGFPLQGRHLLFGLGILPVASLQIEDPQRVQALLDRVEQRSGIHATAATQGGQHYRRYDLGRLAGIAAVTPKRLILALVPVQGEAELLPLVLGQKSPQQNLAAAGTFEAVRRQHHFPGLGEGYVDFQRLLEMMLGEARGVNAQVLQALGFEGPPASPGCRALARHLVGQVPRLALGITEAETDGYRFTSVLEASPAVAGWFKRLAASVPGLGQEDQAMAEVGLALDLPVLRDGLKTLLATVLKQGGQCEEVRPDRLKQAMQSIDMMFNPMLASIRGFDLVLEDLTLGPDGQPADARGRLVVAALDPRGLLGMLGMFSPDLAALQVPDDGRPVQLPLGPLAGQAPPAWVAARGQVLAVFFGGQPPKDTAAVLQAGPGRSGLLFTMRYNVQQVLQRIGPTLRKKVAEVQGPDAEEVRRMLGEIEQAGRLYRSVGVEVMGRDDGLAIDSRVQFVPDPGS